MTKTHYTCQDCNNEFLSPKKLNAKYQEQRPQCKCGSRNLKDKK